MAVRHLYETAFDSTASPADIDEDPEDILETSRRLCSPDPAIHAHSQRPSPATSRSSTDSDRSGGKRVPKRSPRSPALPLRKLFTPWVCGADRKESKSSETHTEAPSCSTEEKSKKTFSPSVEFKKLDVAEDESKKSPQISSLPAKSTAADNRASTNNLVNENSILEIMPPNTSSYTSFELKGYANTSADLAIENGKGPCDSDKSSESTPILNFGKNYREDMKRSNLELNSATRNNLWLDFSRAPKRMRRHLCLDIQNEDEIEPTAHLMKQEWYHGSISRADAENLLRLMKKGSFLVRCSEKLKRQYLLSLKSSRGVMHVKIVQLPTGKYVIKQQTQTFDSIPQLIQYFSTHILNIHEMNVYLTHPVIEKLL
uniref:SH2 domain-containing adapter protein B n=1 Tax=Parasteatoda tepidariorum TaxID=114398 RepID=A0A2L2YJ58_PARTP